MVTFTINIPQMLPYIAYMDHMGYGPILGVSKCGIQQTSANSMGRKRMTFLCGTMWHPTSHQSMAQM